MTRPKPVVLMILDGWGINPDIDGNAVAASGTPFLNELMNTCAHTRLKCSGEDVGLPAGIMGNSEVGHLNIGAGRIVYQDLLRIDKAIADGSFFNNRVFRDIMETLRESGGRLHLMGLVSDGGVHSQLTHLLALIDLARQEAVAETLVHVITDGRDTAPDSGVGFVRSLQRHLEQHEYGAIGSICGRYYAMDRDQRWDRTQMAYRLYTEGKGHPETDPVAAVKAAYARDETDEFIKPVVMVDDQGAPAARIADNDAIVFFNFRADRARQITRAFTDAAFSGFDRAIRPALAGYVCMTRYDEQFDLPVAFPPVHLEDILGGVVSRQGLRQLRIAETEKYAHVTYFFNGGEEKPFEGEDRILIPSPRDIPTYDHKPEMSAEAVTHELIRQIDRDVYDVVVVNFANMDMVGHTGVFDAAVRACTVVDQCVEQIVSRVRKAGGLVLVTADHGNSEQMRAEGGGVHTAHTTNPVRLILVTPDGRRPALREGRLGDIAPTILDLMDIEQPEAMTGQTLLNHS